MMFYVLSFAPVNKSPEVLCLGTKEGVAMAKGQKRPPLPAPVLTEKDRAHLNWIRQNSANLVRSALTLYREGGRGAFIVREEDAKPSGTAARYFTATSVLTTGLVWPDVTTAELV